MMISQKQNNSIWSKNFHFFATLFAVGLILSPCSSATANPPSFYGERQEQLWNYYNTILKDSTALTDIVQEFTYTSDSQVKLSVRIKSDSLNDSTRIQIDRLNTILELIPDHIQSVMNKWGMQFNIIEGQSMSQSKLTGSGSHAYKERVSFYWYQLNEKRGLYVALHEYGHTYDYVLDKIFYGATQYPVGNNAVQGVSKFSGNYKNELVIGDDLINYYLSKPWAKRFRNVYIDKTDFKSSPYYYEEPDEYFAQAFALYYLSGKNKAFLKKEYYKTWALFRALEVTLFDLEAEGISKTNDEVGQSQMTKNSASKETVLKWETIFVVLGLIYLIAR